MKQLKSTGLHVVDGRFFVLDQQLLPHQEVWIEVKDPIHMVEIIGDLKIRGAPMIGICASIALALYAERGASASQIWTAKEALRISRPTAVNLNAALTRMSESYQEAEGSTAHQIAALVATAERIFEEDVALCERIADVGLDLLEESESILTICNTGRIATAGKGTALGIIYKAHESGRAIKVYACETRPLLQGGRLTTWELLKHGVPCELLCDSAAGALMAQGSISKILVGADRIARNGDTANKIGTYSLAVLAQYHSIPFYVVAPYTTLDSACPNGDAMVIEQRPAREVTGVAGSFGSVTWTPSNIDAFNPAFDVTPAHLITGIVLDSGYVSQEHIRQGAFER